MLSPPLATQARRWVAPRWRHKHDAGWRPACDNLSQVVRARGALDLAIRVARQLLANEIGGVERLEHLTDVVEIEAPHDRQRLGVRRRRSAKEAFRHDRQPL